MSNREVGKMFIDPKLLVAAMEISKRAQVSHSAVSNWAKRHDSFPDPIATLSTGRIWYWPKIETWLKKTKRLPK